MKWWILLIVAVPVGLIVLMAGIGLLLPKAHVVSRSATYLCSSSELFRIITDFRSMPTWRSGLREVRPREGGEGWVEVNKMGELPLEMIENVPDQKLVMKIAPGLKFGGTWTYELVPREGRCTLTITERGEVYNPIFRFLSRFVIGHSANIEQYHRDLAKRLERGR